MILADTSDWIELLSHRHPALLEQMQQQQVLMHPWVMGELALGSLPDREVNLVRFSLLSQAPVIEDSLVMKLVDRYNLYNRGIGWVDCQLLASAKAMQANLWTQDKALSQAWAKVRRS